MNQPARAARPAPFKRDAPAIRRGHRRHPRVLLILTEFPPRIGGMQTHAIYLSHYLARRGYPIEVVTYRPSDAEEKQAVASLDACLPFPIHRKLSRIGLWQNLDELEGIAKRFRPDLIYASTVFYSLLGPRLGIPVVCRSVGNDIIRPWIAYPFRPLSKVVSSPWLERRLFSIFQRMRHNEWLERVFQQARRRLMERSARASALVLANSEFTAGLLQDIGLRDNQIQLLVGGVDTRRFARPRAIAAHYRRKLRLPENRYIIVTACRLEAKKGIDFLLQSFARLRQEVPDAHLVIVGDGKQGSYYQWLAESLGLSDRVTFTGRVPHNTVHTYYWAANLFVLASREYLNPSSGVRDVETMGRVLCEANAAGVPVIAARSGGIPSVISHEVNGLLFEPEDTSDLVDQVKRMREEPALVTKMVENGRQASWNRFDWSVVLSAHERVFEQLTKKNSKPGSDKTKKQKGRRVK